MLGAVLVGEVKRPVVGKDIVCQAACLAPIHCHVGRYASTVAHLASVYRMKHVGKAVGRALDVAVCVAVRIVDGLNQASARNVIFRGGNLEHIVKRQRHCGLHQSFSKRAASNHHGAVKILHRAGNNLRRRCRTAVNKDAQRNLRVDRLLRGLVNLLFRLQPSLCAYNLRVFRHEEVGNLDGTLNQASTIATQVEDKRLYRLVAFQRQQCVAHLVG